MHFPVSVSPVHYSLLGFFFVLFGFYNIFQLVAFIVVSYFKGFLFCSLFRKIFAKCWHFFLFQLRVFVCVCDSMNIISFYVVYKTYHAFSIFICSKNTILSLSSIYEFPVDMCVRWTFFSLMGPSTLFHFCGLSQQF